MNETRADDKAALLRFNITQTVQIHLTRLKMYTYSNKSTKTHKCHICKYSSKFKCPLIKHLRSHSGEKPFACPLCKYKSTQKSNLNSHITTHTGEKRYNCNFCTKPFIVNAYKSAHENRCKLNPKQSDHRWVEMQKTFKCEICSYSTAEQSSLKRHVMTHTGQKPFPCNLCNKTFREPSTLRNHIFTHTGEKPYDCQFCKRGFAQVGNQKKHEKICKLNPKQGDAKWVEEHKKFKCHFCIYRTFKKEKLKNHLRSHTGEKPYKCSLCFHKCSIHSNLHCHLRHKHVAVKGLKCPECDFTTLSTSKFLNHVKQCHAKL